MKSDIPSWHASNWYTHHTQKHPHTAARWCCSAVVVCSAVPWCIYTSSYITYLTECRLVWREGLSNPITLSKHNFRLQCLCDLCSAWNLRLLCQQQLLTNLPLAAQVFRKSQCSTHYSDSEVVFRWSQEWSIDSVTTIKSAMLAKDTAHFEGQQSK